MTLSVEEKGRDGDVDMERESNGQDVEGTGAKENSNLFAAMPEDKKLQILEDLVNNAKKAAKDVTVSSMCEPDCVIVGIIF